MNTLLLTIDSLRYDYVSFEKTPKIFKMIENPIFFTNCVSNGPATPSSFKCIFTGCYWRTLSEEERRKRMMAKLFQGNGYKTIGVQSNTPLTIGGEFSEGFNIYEDTWIPWLGFDRKKNITRFLEKLYYYYNGHPSLSAKATTDKCLKLMDQIEGDFFFWQHYMNVHVPYFLKSNFNLIDKYKANKIFQKSKYNPDKLTQREKEYLEKAYDKEVERVDKEISRLLRGIKDRGLWDDTIIVITSDHGDAFGLHGRYLHPSDFVYEETIHIPLIMRIPGRESMEIDEVVGSIDLKPTLAELFDIEDDLNTHGESLVPLLEGNKLSRNGVLTFGNEIVSLRQKRWKYIFDINKEKGELYDLEKDPNELNDLYEEREDKAFQMHEQLKAKLSEFEDLDFEMKVHGYKDTDKEVESRLRALGYVD